jgi:hypothetical protein
MEKKKKAGGEEGIGRHKKKTGAQRNRRTQCGKPSFSNCPNGAIRRKS